MMLSLLRAQKFLPLFLTQALGALNDNLFKNALVVLALYRLAHAGAILVALAGGIFLLPYALFSATAGQIADGFEKSRLIRWIKLWELALMLLAAAGFFSGSFFVLVLVLFGLGLQATFFSPLKYGILPDHLRGSELLTGNGLVEAGTFSAILLGTAAGGFLILLPHGSAIAACACLLVALAGLAAAWRIPPAPPVAPARVGWNILAETVALLGLARKNRSVWFACLGISWFWAFGATLLAEFPTLARDVLHADGQIVTLMLAVFAAGVGIGSLIVTRLVHGSDLLRFVAPAGLGITLFTVDFVLTGWRAHGLVSVPAMLASAAGWHLLLDLLLLSICGGGFSVPFYVLLQTRADPAFRARMVGANNIANALATVAAAGLAAGLYAGGLGAPVILLLAASVNVAIAIWIFGAAPRHAAAPAVSPL